MVALALSNGGPRWEVAVGDPRGATELERIADVSGVPVMVGREVCAVAYQGRIGCVDASTGATRWAKEFSSEVGLGADERNVYGADERGNVNAFTRDAGVSVWRNNTLANRRPFRPGGGRTRGRGGRLPGLHAFPVARGRRDARACRHATAARSSERR